MEEEAPPATPPLIPLNLSIEGGSGGGARLHAIYHDRAEDVVAVTRDDLREIGTMGWLQEGTGAVGMFFFSGAFWLLVTLYAEHSDEATKYAPWFLLCGASMLFGLVLLVVGFVMFRVKQRRLRKYFPVGEG